MSSFDHPVVTQRYFFGRPKAPPNPVPVSLPSGDLLCCHLARCPDPDAPTVVFFHGNGEVVADYVPGHDALLNALGVHVFYAEYRGYGGSTGTPKLAAMLDDVVAIRDHLDLPARSLIAFGRSIGSIYAIELAHRTPGIGGLVLESGIADVLERILLRAEPRELGASIDELRAQAAQHFDHERKLCAIRSPLLVMHAIQDHLVDAGHARRNASWSADPSARLVLFERGDHNTIFAANRDAYLRELDAFFERVRRPS
ncbi:MAG: alpha/beta fold hydrolase [Myxococcota bacterium]